MFIKLWKVYLKFFIAFFFIDWFLGVARFYWPPFGTIFTVVNYPFSTLFLWLEGKNNLWWYSVFGRRLDFLLNDEIGMVIAFFLMVLLQSILLASIYLLFKTWRRNKRASSTA
ncbi:MAG: hypothetical protein HQ555_06810 [Candidatus Aminicenantes bacterium]|nr:hypothetical protein [Candidatus Aminicenantes bacterium]